jgi:hypothetical protein
MKRFAILRRCPNQTLAMLRPERFQHHILANEFHAASLSGRTSSAAAIVEAGIVETGIVEAAHVRPRFAEKEKAIVIETT